MSTPLDERARRLREEIGPTDDLAFSQLVATELLRFTAGRGRNFPHDIESFIHQTVGVRRAMIRFLQGVDVDAEIYNPDNWRAFKFHTPKFDIESVLAMISDKEVKRDILAGRPWSFMERSNIPNTIGIFHRAESQLAVKMGREESIRRSTRALLQLQGLSEHSTSFQAAYPSGFATRTGLKTGMLVTDFIPGAPMESEMWRERREDLKAYCSLKLTAWRNDYLQRNEPGRLGHGFTFNDGLSPANCILDPLGFVYIIDADGFSMKGKGDIDNGYVSGEPVSSLALELATVGLRLQDLGFNHEPSASIVYI